MCVYHVRSRVHVSLLHLQEFVGQCEDFKRQIEDMEQRLGQIVCQAFDDCSGCESALKVLVLYSVMMIVDYRDIPFSLQLLEMMGSLLERPLVHRDFQTKYPVLLSMYDRELDQTKVIFNQQISQNRSPQVHIHICTLTSLIHSMSLQGPCINKNMPPVAGLLRWTQELRERIGGGMEKLRNISHR